MTVTNAIKALLHYKGMKQYELGKLLGKDKNSFNNKIRKASRWTAPDLIKVANIIGAQLAFILPDGTEIVLSEDDTPEGE